MNYNTTREHLVLPEYGRHIQQLVDHAITIKDDAERQKIAEQVIALMGFLNPQVKTVENYEQKLWDHLFAISDFKLKCNSPYPVPSREDVYSRPSPMSYPQGKIKFRHYGRNIKSMIDKAAAMEDEEKKQGFKENIASFMKRTYQTYHKEGVNDNVIKGDLDRMSEGQLTLTEEENIYVKGGISKSRHHKRRKGGSNRNNNKKNYRKRPRR